MDILLMILTEIAVIAAEKQLFPVCCADSEDQATILAETVIKYQ